MTKDSPASQDFEALVAKYLAAKENAPRPDMDAYNALLRGKRNVLGEDALRPVGASSGGDVILAAGPSPNGGTELLVQKSDGVVVLLMKDMMQVKNTPKGPKNYMPQRPLELPLVRRLKPTDMVISYCRARGLPVPPALLMFQGRFSTACRQVNLL